MKINLNDKGQVKVILILGIIIVLSTLIIATAISNETNLIEQNATEISLEENNADASLSNQFYAEMPEAWWTTCADGVSIVWDSNKQVTMPSDNDQTITINGAYKPSLHTYEAFPECVNMNDMSNYVDMDCLMKKCSEIIKYNVINGERRTIWRQGDIW